jgi:hypothetical protein
MKFNYLALLFCISLQVTAQYAKLSDAAEVSLITIGPGKYLYDAFGHSAFRIKDPALNFDRAYNYGSYDSFEDGFYYDFTLGTADYKLARADFDRFIGSYQRQNRWVKEQVLDFNQEEVQQIYEYLENNARPENAYYRYDQFFDNCATKLRDVPQELLGERLKFNADQNVELYTMRAMVDQNSFNHPWIDLGIDIALGNIIDREATLEEHMFLPDYVFSIYADATIEKNGLSVPIVKETRELVVTDYYERPVEQLHPWMVFSVLALIVVILTFRDHKLNRRSRGLDLTIFLFTGLIGALLIFLWFGTHHTTTVNNLNILWAFFPNLIVAFYLFKKEPPLWTRVYVRFLVILLFLMAIVWLTRFQVYNWAMLPVMIMLGVRYVFLWQKGLLKVPQT